MAGSLAALKQDRLEGQIAEHGRLEQAAGGGLTHVDISSCPDISNEGVQVQPSCLSGSMLRLLVPQRPKTAMGVRRSLALQELMHSWICSSWKSGHA